MDGVKGEPPGGPHVFHEDGWDQLHCFRCAAAQMLRESGKHLISDSHTMKTTRFTGMLSLLAAAALLLGGCSKTTITIDEGGNTSSQGSSGSSDDGVPRHGRKHQHDPLDVPHCRGDRRADIRLSRRHGRDPLHLADGPRHLYGPAGRHADGAERLQDVPEQRHLRLLRRLDEQRPGAADLPDGHLGGALQRRGLPLVGVRQL